MKQFKSVAKWPKTISVGPYDSNISEDFHVTFDEAECICHTLEEEGFGGAREVFPEETWVEQEFDGKWVRLDNEDYLQRVADADINHLYPPIGFKLQKHDECYINYEIEEPKGNIPGSYKYRSRK